jgi:hypothetical protein
VNAKVSKTHHVSMLGLWITIQFIVTHMPSMDDQEYHPTMSQNDILWPPNNNTPCETGNNDTKHNITHAYLIYGDFLP